MIRLPLLLAMVLLALPARAEFITLQSTTSTENSGLFEHLLPRFTEATGIEVRVVAVGTGQAIRNAMRGDGDVLLVHSRADEEAFVAAGHGEARRDVMHNDFVIVGSAADPAGVKGTADAVGALATIATSGARFASRGDDSGTHKAERRLWADTGVDVDAASGTWYLETGSGMGATLNTAVGLDAYALTDRATWAAHGNRGDHAILVEGDPRLFNQYGVIAVSPERHPNVKAAEARRFVDWLTGPEGQGAIAAFRVDGQQLFVPNAGAPDDPPGAAERGAAEPAVPARAG